LPTGDAAVRAVAGGIVPSRPSVSVASYASTANVTNLTLHNLPAARSIRANIAGRPAKSFAGCGLPGAKADA